MTFEAKLVVRMLFKTYSLVLIRGNLTTQRFHSLLPNLLSFQNTFKAAVQLLQAPTIRRMPFRGKGYQDPPCTYLHEHGALVGFLVLRSRPR
jgi:hypothetical protein